MNHLKLLFDLAKLKRNENISKSEMEKLQKKKLQKLLQFAYKNSNYYHDIFESNGISAKNINSVPLKDFPSLDKDSLMKNFDELITVKNLTQQKLKSFDEKNDKSKKTLQNKYHIVHSSGSTGEPRYFLYDNYAWQQMLLGIIRGALWGMNMKEILSFLLHGPRIMYIAATDGRYGGAMAVGDGIEGVGAKQLFLDINTPLTEWVRQIKDFKPNMIIGYPSAIKILGELAETERLNMNILRVVSCGEPLSHGLRKNMEDIFDSQVINFYGASESLALGLEADSNDGMILFDDLNVIEVIDGQMYLTCLYNFAQPLIRYRLSDRLTLRNLNEHNKSPFSYADILLSRSEDLLWFENKNGEKEFLHPLTVEGFCIPNLIDYQFVQNSFSSFTLRAQIENQTENKNCKESIKIEITKQMTEILQSKNLTNISFSIDFVDEINPNPKTGKKQLIISLKSEVA